VGGACGGNGGKRKASEGNRPLGRRRRRWVGNIKLGLVEIDCVGVDWIGVAQDRYSWRALMNAAMNLRVP
jgi:hypothetical protein